MFVVIKSDDERCSNCLTRKSKIHLLTILGSCERIEIDFICCSVV